MSVSARTDMSLMEKKNKITILLISAFESCEKGRYLSAYKEYSKALKCVTDTDMDNDPKVIGLRTDIENQMNRVGNLDIFDARLRFIEIDPHAFDPFCMCSNGRAHDHWCDFCIRGKTVLDLYRWEQAKLEREVSLANLVKLKREQAQVLLERANKLREQVQLLDEELISTLREARHAKQDLVESRGW
jgi:hypothetical protein